MVQQVSLVERPSPPAQSGSARPTRAPGRGHTLSLGGFVGELSRKIIARSGAFGSSTQLRPTKSCLLSLHGQHESPGPAGLGYLVGDGHQMQRAEEGHLELCLKRAQVQAQQPGEEGQDLAGLAGGQGPRPRPGGGGGAPQEDHYLTWYPSSSCVTNIDPWTGPRKTRAAAATRPSSPRRRDFRRGRRPGERRPWARVLRYGQALLQKNYPGTQRNFFALSATGLAT